MLDVDVVLVQFSLIVRADITAQTSEFHRSVKVWGNTRVLKPTPLHHR